ncbi:NAD(P)-dependent oxidoreductase [soil metagenome]
METIAVVGLGQMGGAIASRLHSSGAQVAGFDVDSEARARAANAGMPVVDQLADAMAGRSIVMTSLPNSGIVREVWLGKQGLVDSLKEGQVCIELSSIDPETMREVARAARARGAAVLDCPVSGSPGEALEGKLVLLVGAEVDDLERVRPVLQHLSGNIQLAGGIGAGKVVKIVNNMMTMANILAASEAFSLGVHSGVEPGRLFEILSGSGGRSAQFLKRFPWAVAGDFESRFKMELGEKDLSLGIDLGRSVGQPTPLASTARELYALALAQGHRGRDIVALFDMYQHWGSRQDHSS